MVAAIQFGCGFLSAMAISIPLIWWLGFGQVRHSLSIIGSISILLASAYVLRSKGIVRFGKRQIWIRFHRILASFGLTLIFVHGAFKPTYWYSWLPFILALGSLVTGLAISTAKIRNRKHIRLIHSFLSPFLLISIVLHGSKKMDHDNFFPLSGEHQVACIQCHTDSNYIDYTCLTCHAHNNPEVLEPHSIHGVIPYNPTSTDVQVIAQCLDCHQTEINQKEYGKKRANWHYNTSY